MCLRPAASCRLCLSDKIGERCLDLTEDVTTADQLQELLCLQWSLAIVTIASQPHHVCVTCHSVITAFKTLKQTAQNSELTLQEKYHFAKLEEDFDKIDKEVDKSHDGINIDFDNSGENVDNDESVNDMNNPEDIKKEENDNEDLIKISFSKPEKPKTSVNDRSRSEPVVDPKTGKIYDRRKENAWNVEVRKMVEKEILAMGMDLNDKEAIMAARYTCPLCGKTGLKRETFTKHLRWAHNERQYKCDHPGCGMAFKRPSALEVHSVNHKEKEVCQLCGESFKRLKVHILEAHKKERKRCEYCNKAFISKMGLEYHINTVHLGKGKEMCTLCGAEVIDIKHHIDYMHNNKNTDKFECEHPGCGKRFKTAQQARGHLKTHSDTKEQCKICGTMVKNLNTHYYQIHTAKEKFKCDHCGKGQKSRYDLRAHLAKVHAIHSS